MVTVLGILCNSLWILGLAGVLATFSYTNWRRQQTNLPAAHGKVKESSWKVAMQTTEFGKPFSLSMFLVSVGIGASGWQATSPEPIWQTALWFVLALLFAIQFFVYFKQG